MHKSEPHPWLRLGLVHVRPGCMFGQMLTTLAGNKRLGASTFRVWERVWGHLALCTVGKVPEETVRNHYWRRANVDLSLRASLMVAECECWLGFLASGSWCEAMRLSLGKSSQVSQLCVLWYSPLLFFCFFPFFLLLLLVNLPFHPVPVTGWQTMRVQF